MIREFNDSGKASLNNYGGTVIMRWLDHTQCGNCWKQYIEKDNIEISKAVLEAAYK